MRQTGSAALGVSVLDPVPYTEVPALLASRDVLVNNMREGALDKVVYEAAATGMPVLASNSGFDDLLPPELRFAREDAAGLAERLARACRHRSKRPRPAAPRSGRGEALHRALGRPLARGRRAASVEKVVKEADLHRDREENGGEGEADGERRLQLSDENGDRQKRRFAT